MKIIKNTKNEINTIVDEIQSDLEFNFNSMIIEYLSKLVLKSLDNSIYIPENIKLSIIDYYEIAETNLLKATIHSNNSKEKDLFKHVAYETYLRIFEKYEDELSFEVCSNFDKIETTLDSTKFYGIRFNLNELLNLKNKNIPYINRRLLRLRFLDLKYNNSLF
jgi:hypothetical protein